MGFKQKQTKNRVISFTEVRRTFCKVNLFLAKAAGAKAIKLDNLQVAKPAPSCARPPRSIIKVVKKGNGTAEGTPKGAAKRRRVQFFSFCHRQYGILLAKASFQLKTAKTA